jgi:hypothetical protein
METMHFNISDRLLKCFIPFYRSQFISDQTVSVFNNFDRVESHCALLIRHRGVLLKCTVQDFSDI